MNKGMGLALALAILTSCSTAFAAEPWTANTMRLAKGETGARATIADMAWYAGTWRGEGLDGLNEEIWSKPEHGAMMGMYRLIKDGRARFYELLTITEENGTLLLKIKHFHPDLRGWEERDVSVQMPFISAKDGRYYFEGITFEPRPGNTVKIYLVIESKDRKGPVREEVFSYRRVP
jgi:hypothetical protein